jgi:hypothetical protein
VIHHAANARGLFVCETTGLKIEILGVVAYGVHESGLNPCPSREPQMNKQDLQRRIDPDYFGTGCFDDKDLEESEKELEKKLLEKHNNDF